MSVQEGKFSIGWRDSGRKAQCPPNPAYPEGVYVNALSAGDNGCFTQLPYPAAGCGLHVIECLICGYRIAVTAAGRPDDPRSVTLPCRPMGRA